MKQAAKFAGFLAAHAMMALNDNDHLCVLYGYINDDGEQVAESTRKGKHNSNVKAAQKNFLENLNNVSASVLVYNYPSPIVEFNAVGKNTDLLVVEFSCGSQGFETMVIGLPNAPTYMDNKYSSEEPPDFEVYDIEEYKIPANINKDAKNEVITCFLEGINDHQVGSNIWRKYKSRLPTISDWSQVYQACPFDSQNAIVRSSVDTQNHFSEKYDDEDWHSGGEGFAEGLPISAGCTHIGMFLAWCTINGLEGDEHADELLPIKKMYQKRISAPGKWLYEYCDGTFMSDHLSDLGIEFAKIYYNGGEYLDDYASKLEGEVESLYEVEDSWNTYDKIAVVIQKRFNEWKNSTK